MQRSLVNDFLQIVSSKLVQERVHPAELSQNGRAENKNTSFIQQKKQR